MIGRLGAFSARHARPVVAFWVLAAIAMLLAAPSLTKVGVQDETAFLPPTSPSLRAEHALERLFPGDPSFSSAVVVLSAERALGPADERFLHHLDRFLASSVMRHEISAVESPASSPALSTMLISPDRRSALVVVGMRPAPFTSASEAAVTRLRAFLSRSAPPGLSTYVTGITGLGADEAAAVTSSFAKAGLVAGLLIILILFLVYRSAVALVVPLGTIGVGFAVAQGLVGLLAAHGFKVASLAATFMIIVVFGAGTDYCLFIVSRYREELDRQSDPDAALAVAMRSVGPIVVASGATVVLGFGSLLFARFGIYRTMGPAIGVAVAVVLAASLTFTPAVLWLLGTRVRARARHQRPSRQRARAPFGWRRLGTLVTRRPVLLSAVPVVVLVGGCAGLFSLHQSFDVVRELPSDAGSRVGYDALARHFAPGQLAPIEIGIDAPGAIADPARLAQIDRLTTAVRAVPGVEKALSITEPLGEPITPASLSGHSDLTSLVAALPADERSRLAAAVVAPGGLRFTGTWIGDVPSLRSALSFFLGVDGRSTRLEVTLAADPYSPAGLETLHRVEAVAHRTLASGPLAGSSVVVGGASVAFGDIQQLATADLGRIIAVVLLLVLMVLMLLLRAVVAPLYLVATVVLSFGAALGVTAMVFDRLLGQGAVSFWVPPFLFVILVALGADYTVFVMGRIREARRRGLDVPGAAVEGLVASGPVISAAGLVLAGTFAVLLVTPLPTLREVGFAVTLGVLVDTFVVRPLLVPALTALAGRWAFWPGEREAAAPSPRWGRRWAPALGLLGVAVSVAVVGAQLSTSPSGHRAALSPSRPSVASTAPSAAPTPAVGGAPTLLASSADAKPLAPTTAAEVAVAHGAQGEPASPAVQPVPLPPTSPPGTACGSGIFAGLQDPLRSLVCVVEHVLVPSGAGP